MALCTISKAEMPVINLPLTLFWPFKTHVELLPKTGLVNSVYLFDVDGLGIYGSVAYTEAAPS